MQTALERPAPGQPHVSDMKHAWPWASGSLCTGRFPGRLPGKTGRQKRMDRQRTKERGERWRGSLACAGATVGWTQLLGISQPSKEPHGTASAWTSAEPESVTTRLRQFQPLTLLAPCPLPALKGPRMRVGVGQRGPKEPADTAPQLQLRLPGLSDTNRGRSSEGNKSSNYALLQCTGCFNYWN